MKFLHKNQQKSTTNHTTMMDFKGKPEISHEEEEEEEEERQNMLTSAYFGGGGGPATVKVVEYMVSSMSKELLCKFPDNSAFDFDYTQSSIWSPLLPHPSNSSFPFQDLQRKLFYDDDARGGDGRISGNTTAAAVVKKLTGDIKEKIVRSSVFNCFQIDQKIKKKMMKKRRKSFKGFDHFSPVPPKPSVMAVDSASIRATPSKGWAKVLKAASRKFKKTMKKKDSAVNLKLSNGFSHRTTSFF